MSRSQPFTSHISTSTLALSHTKSALNQVCYWSVCMPMLSLYRSHQVSSYQREGNMEPNVVLTVATPSQFYIPSHQVYWEIVATSPTSTHAPHELWGNSHQIHLTSGTYRIRLRIGFYQKTHTVQIAQNRMHKISLTADLGRIQAAANTMVTWTVKNAQTGEIMPAGTSVSLNIVVGVGTYTVDVALSDLHRSETLTVQLGKSSHSKFYLPAGRVNLMATMGNSPLFKPASWVIYRLRAGERIKVGEYDRYTQEVMMPPGHYEAVVTFEDKVRSKRFWVKNGASNRVTLAMD